jgi:hypothetical protein
MKYNLPPAQAGTSVRDEIIFKGKHVLLILEIIFSSGNIYRHEHDSHLVSLVNYNDRSLHSLSTYSWTFISTLCIDDL